jgi:hypothetical protein
MNKRDHGWEYVGQITDVLLLVLQEVQGVSR